MSFERNLIDYSNFKWTFTTWLVVFKIGFVPFYSLGHFSSVYNRQDHIFEQLILEMTKVNFYSLVI